MTDTKEQDDGFWAIVEVMGHQRFAGFVSEYTLGGASFVRVEIPATGEGGAFSKIFGAGSIYCITPVHEDVARGAAIKMQNKPVTAWDMPDEWRQRLQQRSLSFDPDEDEDPDRF